MTRSVTPNSQTVASPSKTASVIVVAVIDVLLVCLFLFLGRRSHDAPPSLEGYLSSLWPFLLALALGWIITNATAHPLRISTGVGISLTTIAAGMTVRALSGQGIHISFVLVASGVLLVFLVGWRIIAHAVNRSRKDA